MRVETATVVTEHHDTAGNFTPGGKIDFTVHGKPGYLAALIMSAGYPRTITPVSSFGCFFLDLQGFFPMGFGILGSTGTWQTSLPIPNDPVFRNVHLIFQTAMLHLPTQAAILANASCVQIK
jgi:hypothetical protein